VLTLKEEDFKAKEFEGLEPTVRPVPQLPDLDMKMMPTFKDTPVSLAEDMKMEELAQS
jgi:hypothetical protein